MHKLLFSVSVLERDKRKHPTEPSGSAQVNAKSRPKRTRFSNDHADIIDGDDFAVEERGNAVIVSTPVNDLASKGNQSYSNRQCRGHQRQGLPDVSEQSTECQGSRCHKQRSRSLRLE